MRQTGTNTGFDGRPAPSPGRRAIGLAALLSAVLAWPASAAAAETIDPDDPFGGIDLTTWHLAEYLSGTQKDMARLTFMEQLPPDQLAELGRRCDLLEPDFARFEDNVRLVCESARAVLNLRR